MENNTFIWNASNNGIINLCKVRNFEIIQDEYGTSITAWFSDSESLNVGRFKTLKEAKTFLSKISNLDS